jgi:peptidylprolyl isomerase
MADPIKTGDTISVEYTGKFDSGETFDTSQGRAPLKFTVGAGQLIPGFDAAVINMLPGDKKTVTIAPEEGYGAHDPQRVTKMPRAGVPKDMEVKVGMAVQLADQAGNPIPAMVMELTDEDVVLDLNHPLSGKTLVFDIEIKETGLTPDAQPDPQGGCDTAACGSCGGSCGGGE